MRTLFVFSDVIQGQLPVGIQNATLLVAALVVLVIISFSIAGSQAAIFSLDEKDIDVLKTKQQPSAKRILNLLEEPKEVFTSMLIAKTLVNICTIVLANYLINYYVPAEYLDTVLGIFLKFAVIAFAILFLVEIFPRVWATQNNLRFAFEWPVLIMIVEAIYLLLRRISRWTVALADSFGRTVGANKVEETNIQQIDETIDIQTDEVTPEEKNIMKGIVKFGKISVKKVMRNRLYVSGIKYDTPFEELIRQVGELHYSRLPVYKSSLDEIAGVLNIKDLVPYLDDGTPIKDWHTRIRAPYFVPETKLIEDLLLDFQKRRIHFAVVVDEFGGTSGIVTMEDIIEEVVGEVKDEFDDEDLLINKIDDNNYIFEGRTMLHDMCKALKLPIETFDEVRGDSESLGGLINELSGELTRAGDVVQTGDFEFTVMETEKNRVKTAKVTINRDIGSK
ncbi:gliding motility-associated protein GldE [Niabella hirudinis]|uniref:gliding motility-associated protein GldE n=1 Tax=Niabella hirudinis TaxID=1285929 RepID=UPI003EBA7BA0